MSRAESAIFTVLCMLYDENGNILVQDRTDPNWPGICFPGGHVEKGESFTQAAIREVLEETGLTMEDATLCGIKQFQTEHDERYVVFFYKATKWHGTLSGSQEGEVKWIPRSEINRYKTVSDFADMLKVFENSHTSEFYYFQQDGKWNFSLL